MPPGLEEFAPALAAVQRNARIVSNRNDPKKFLLNFCEPDQVAWQRFSVATDVIAFLRLNHLTADQTASLSRGVENN